MKDVMGKIKEKGNRNSHVKDIKGKKRNLTEYESEIEHLLDEVAACAPERIHARQTRNWPRRE